MKKKDCSSLLYELKEARYRLFDTLDESFDHVHRLEKKIGSNIDCKKLLQAMEENRDKVYELYREQDKYITELEKQMKKSKEGVSKRTRKKKKTRKRKK